MRDIFFENGSMAFACSLSTELVGMKSFGKTREASNIIRSIKTDCLNGFLRYRTYIALTSSIWLRQLPQRKNAQHKLSFYLVVHHEATITVTIILGQCVDLNALFVSIITNSQPSNRNIFYNNCVYI